MGLGVLLSFVSLSCLGYLIYFYTIKLKPAHITAKSTPTYTEEVGNKIKNSSHEEYRPFTPFILKQRVTAIRTGMFPGLYDKGQFIDNLEKAPKYFVEELIVSKDKDFYTKNFFETGREMNEALTYSKTVNTIDQYIKEEL